MDGKALKKTPAAAMTPAPVERVSGAPRAASIIVIVDDRVTNRDILSKLASSLEEKTVVKAFADPLPALEWMSVTTPDLVITDYKMPSMDGSEFTRRLRCLPFCHDVPIIVVTVYEDRDFRYKALEAGATDFLLSPLDHYEFRARAHNLLTLRKQQEIIKKRAVILEQKLRTTNDLRKEELRESEEKLRLVTNCTPAMICVTDSAGSVVFVNDYQARFFGADAAAASGASAASLFGEDYAMRHLALDDQVFETGETLSGLEETFENPGGEARTFLTTKAPLRTSSGQTANVVTVSIDISERKAAERALREAKEVAEAGNRTKTEFLASMSHELRTPLNAVMGFADVMKVEMLGPIGNPKYLEYAEDIRSSAEHLLNIINDMLDVSTIEAGRLDLAEGDVDVDRLVEDVIRLMRGRAASAEVAIVWNPVPGLPLLRGDERRLKQVLINVLSNSVKYTPPDGEVVIEAGLLDGGAIALTVADPGIGMTEEEIAVAKARFGRIQGAANRKHAGTGLGLPLAIELTKLHAGTLDLTSMPGEGTKVTIAFPPWRSLAAPRRSEGEAS